MSVFVNANTHLCTDPDTRRTPFYTLHMVEPENSLDLGLIFKAHLH